MTRVKICGITSIEDAIMACDAGADMLGFVLCESERRVGYRDLAEIVAAVGRRAETVGVFATEADLQRYVASSGVKLDYYQVYFDANKVTSLPPQEGWIDAVWIKSEADLPRKTKGLLLADFKKADRQTMRRWWQRSDSCPPGRLIVAGNLTAATVTDVIQLFQPYAVDVARGCEVSPGVKDARLVREFIEEVKRVSA